MNKSLIILASGGGSNADEIIKYFADNASVEVLAVISNRRDAGVHQVAKRHDIPSYSYAKSDRLKGELIAKIEALQPDLIILAGYLLKIPNKLIDTFPNRIVNIHPALLPKYGGKGMYGMNVHRAVLAAKEEKSGITIHFVNENYDEGHIIKQESCTIGKDFNAEKLQQEVLKLEHYYYPRVIEKILRNEY